VGHKFSLILSREITDEESVALKETDAVCANAVFATDTLPTNAEVTVTKMDFDDMVSPSLAEAIEAALQAVQKVPDLTVPGLTVPAVLAPAPAESDVIEGVVVEEESAEKKTSTRKSATKRTSSRKRATVGQVDSAGAAGDDGAVAPQGEKAMQTA
jgi:hypothetical protein